MSMRNIAIAVALMLVAMPPAAYGQRAPKGTLIIVGGGPRARDYSERFALLAGGAGGRLLVFAQASAAANAGQGVLDAWNSYGLTGTAAELTREQALNADTAALFKDVTAIWFGGGDQSRLTGIIGGTPVETAIRNRYRAGAVIGGTSAGAAVMSEVMITGEEKRVGGTRPPSDSTQTFITIDRDNIVTTRGFGLITNAIVDQHFVRRKRHNRLISLVLEHPHLIGAGIDESTAIEVRPDGQWRVWGESVVVIYDARKAKLTPGGLLGASSIKMHVLRAGDLFRP